MNDGFEVDALIRVRVATARTVEEANEEVTRAVEAMAWAPDTDVYHAEVLTIHQRKQQ